MTSVLAPQGVGLWGQNLRFTGAVGVAPTIPSDAYNRNSIGQRGGTVITPVADVVGVTGVARSNASSDPFNKQAAALIIRDEPKPRTLRDGFVGGEASFERGGIVTPIARVALTKDEVTARLASEGKSERPVSAKPISLDEAIAMLKAAEETWPGEGDPELDQGYIELVSDAKRLKIIKGATMRRPITDEEQGIVNQIANKYASALGGEASEVVAAERAVAAEEARPANEAASALRAAELANQDSALAQNDVEVLEGKLREVNDQLGAAAVQRRRAGKAIENLRVQFRLARDNPRRRARIEARFNDIHRMIPDLDATLAAVDRQYNDLNRVREDTVRAAEGFNDRFDELIAFRAEPSRAGEMRLEMTGRFAPHDRERNKQAATMREALQPGLSAAAKQADAIADEARDQRLIAMGLQREAMGQAADIAAAQQGLTLAGQQEARKASRSQVEAIEGASELARQASVSQKAASLANDIARSDIDSAVREGRQATRLAQESKVIQEEILARLAPITSRLGAMESDIADTRRGVGTMATSLVSTKENPVTIIIQSGDKGRRGESMKDVMREEFTQSGGGFQTTTLADLRRG